MSQRAKRRDDMTPLTTVTCPTCGKDVEGRTERLHLKRGKGTIMASERVPIRHGTCPEVDVRKLWEEARNGTV